MLILLVLNHVTTGCARASGMHIRGQVLTGTTILSVDPDALRILQTTKRAKECFAVHATDQVEPLCLFNFARVPS